MDSLLFSAFLAGVIIFFAPCTFPLVAAFLSFLGGVSAQSVRETAYTHETRRKILLQCVFYICGFSLVFTFFGALFGLGGAALMHYREQLAHIGGVIVIFFGLLLLKGAAFPSLDKFFAERRLPIGRFVRPGHPLSSFLLGISFALGWTPCIGPILGSILTLAATSATVVQGASLLLVFSLGLAAPLLAVAFWMSSFLRILPKVAPLMRGISLFAGALLLVLGSLLLSDRLSSLSFLTIDAFNIMRYDFFADHF